MTTNRHLVVVGASAGGVEALRGLVATLPEDLPATVLIVLHVPATAPSALAAILGRSARLPVEVAEDGTTLRHGRVYTAPGGFHLLVSDGPTENGHRPSVNALFRSAAKAQGPRCVGVVLSGSLDDGAAGLATIVARGGVAVVQDPDEAAFPGMPRAALAEVDTPYVRPVADLGRLLDKLVREQVDLGVVSTLYACGPSCATHDQSAALDVVSTQSAAWLHWYQRTVVLDALEHLHNAARKAWLVRDR